MLKKSVFLKIVAMGTGKRHFHSHDTNDWKEEQMLRQKHELYILDLLLKTWVDWLSARQEKILQHQNQNVLIKSVQKLKKTTFLRFITTFHNSDLKVKLDLATRVFKPTLKTGNVFDVCEYVWLLFLAQSSYL